MKINKSDPINLIPQSILIIGSFIASNSNHHYTFKYSVLSNQHYMTEYSVLSNHREPRITCRQKPQDAQVSVLTLCFLEIVCILLCRNLLSKQRQRGATVDTQFLDSWMSIRQRTPMMRKTMNRSRIFEIRISLRA